MGEPKLANDESLVYLGPWAKRAHRKRSSDNDTTCRALRARGDRVARQGGLYFQSSDDLYGTGTQDEWDRARALPLCATCFPGSKEV